ncbi:MAG: hypothetical protein ACYCPN_05845 [Thermoplasmata archaeon]
MQGPVAARLGERLCGDRREDPGDDPLDLDRQDPPVVQHEPRLNRI